MSNYTIGVDFGTLSARALLIDAQTGEELSQSIFDYPHGVMSTSLPGGAPLPTGWALQHPQDYLDALSHTVRNVIQQSRVDPDHIIGIGIDFTSCTLLPVKADGTPLCMLSAYQNDPHAYVKLWKHHAAEYCAELLNETAQYMEEERLSLYGGKISGEWLIPKVMQIVKEAPQIYDAADRFIEAGDWLVWQLCGHEARSVCNTGYKALWQHDSYPSTSFFKALDPRMENFTQEKLSCDIRPLGSCAGQITASAAKLTGLKEGTAVAVGIIDAHASVPACRIYEPGKMLLIMGTSTCHMLLSRKEMGVKGTCGIVKDGIIPGLYAYEAGQPCVGDLFMWFVENLVPAQYKEAAKAEELNIHQYLRKKAEMLQPGESGLLALDWWNGVRSDLMDFDLTGLILGMNLRTKPEEIYRALIEATAYGTRQIIEAFENAGVPVRELYAAGGIAAKDPMTMQIYADVCKRSIQISGSTQSGALGSAILGAVAAGPEKSGFSSVAQASEKLGRLKDTVYMPDARRAAVYEQLYAEYSRLHDYFGCGGNPVMKTLKKIRETYLSPCQS